MVTLIVGKKGHGKTKKLIAMANEAVAKSKGNVVCIEKGALLTYDIDHAARLIDIEQYGISGYRSLYGYLAGICAGNYDVTDIFVDSTFKIAGDDMEEFTAFVERVKKLADFAETKIVLLVSADINDIPAKVADFAHEI